MQALKIGFMLIAAALWACAGAATPAAAGSTVYYFGRISFFSPDGRIPYGRTEAAVKREILDGGARIIETVTQPGPSPSMRPRETVTVLKRRQETRVYDVSDAGGTLAGTVTFQDPGLETWALDMSLKGGGTITGSGKLSPEGIKAEKRLPDATRPVFVTEDLRTVSETEYKRRVSEMHPPKWAE